MELLCYYVPGFIMSPWKTMDCAGHSLTPSLVKIMNAEDAVRQKYAIFIQHLNAWYEILAKISIFATLNFNCDGALALFGYLFLVYMSYDYIKPMIWPISW